MQILDKITKILNQILAYIAGCFLIAMMILTCSNIFLRTVWMPVNGTYELMGFFGAVVTALALGYTQIRRGHISVDVLISIFSKKTRKILDGINNFICMIFFSLIAWQVGKKGTVLLNTGEVSETLRMAYYPFVYAAALGCAVLALVFLTDLLHSLCGEKR